MEQNDFKNYLLGKLTDYENQQRTLCQKLANIGEIHLVRQAEFDGLKFRNLVLPLVNDELCTSEEGLLKILDRHINSLSERFPEVYELSVSYAMELIAHYKFLIWGLYELRVLSYADERRFDDRLKKLSNRVVESSVENLS